MPASPPRAGFLLTPTPGRVSQRQKQSAGTQKPSKEKEKASSEARRDLSKWAIQKKGAARRGISIDNLWLLRIAPAKQNVWAVELEVLM